MFPNCANSANSVNGENEQRVTYLVTRQTHDAGGRGCDLAPGLIAVFWGDSDPIRLLKIPTMDFAIIMPVNEMSTGTNKDGGQAFLNRALEALLEMKAFPFGGHPSSAIGNKPRIPRNAVESWRPRHKTQSSIHTRPWPISNLDARLILARPHQLCCKPYGSWKWMPFKSRLSHQCCSLAFSRCALPRLGFRQSCVPLPGFGTFRSSLIISRVK